MERNVAKELDALFRYTDFLLLQTLDQPNNVSDDKKEVCVSTHDEANSTYDDIFCEWAFEVRWGEFVV